MEQIRYEKLEQAKERKRKKKIPIKRHMRWDLAETSKEESKDETSNTAYFLIIGSLQEIQIYTKRILNNLKKPNRLEEHLGKIPDSDLMYKIFIIEQDDRELDKLTQIFPYNRIRDETLHEKTTIEQLAKYVEKGLFHCS